MPFFFEEDEFVFIEVVFKELIVGIPVEIRHELGDIIINKFSFIASRENGSGEVHVVDLPEFFGFGGDDHTRLGIGILLDVVLAL